MDSHNGITRLNVGGKIFETSSQTLCKEPDSFLARFCQVDGMQPGIKDASGAFFIDRDPRYFRVILNYLRSNVVDLEGGVSLDAVIAEVDFYGLSSLMKQLEDRRYKKTEQTRVRTASVWSTSSSGRSASGYVYETHLTRFTSSHNDILQQIKSSEKVPAARLTSTGILEVDRIISLATLCEILGHCGLVLRHVQKDATGQDVCFHILQVFDQT